MLENASIKAFIPTVRPQEAKAFYADTLGFELLSEDNYALEFSAHGTLLRVIRVPEYTPHSFTVLGWHVSNIDETVKAMIAKGIRFEKYDFLPHDDMGIWTAPGGTKVAWFKDPDGNTLSLDE